MATVKYPGGVTVSERPDNRGYWRVRGPGLDLRTRDHSEAEARAWQAARERYEAEQEVEVDPGTDEPTVADLAEMYLAGAGRARPLAANTVRTMRSNLRRHALPVIGSLPCSAWDREASLQVMLKCESAGLAASSISKVMNDLSAVAHIGRRLGYLQEDQQPCKGLVGRQRPALQRGTLPTREDIDAFADAFVKVTGQQWRRLQVQLLAFSGLRSSELLALQPGDVNRGTLHVERQLVGRELTLPKHGIVRDTIYPEWMDDELHAWAEQQPVGGPLFPAVKGGYEPYATWLRQRWQPAAEVAGWPRQPKGRWKWTAHTLRHFFGTWALAKDGLGMDVADVAMFLGHSSPEVTHRLYVQSRSDRFARARAASRAVPS